MEIFMLIKFCDFELFWKIYILCNSKFFVIWYFYLVIVKDNLEMRKGSWFDKGRDKSYFMVCFVKFCI